LDDIDLYALLRDACLGREQFMLLDGPPFAFGNFLIGLGVFNVI
jgi:isoleucyl-tRNA synthetase